MIRFLVLVLLFGLFYRLASSIMRNWAKPLTGTAEKSESHKVNLKNLEIEDAKFEEIKGDQQSGGKPH